MIKDKALHEIKAEIRSAILGKLQAERAGGGVLEKINSVHYGNRENVGALHLPSVWLIAAPHTPELRSGHSVWHDFTFDIVVMAHSYEPDEGAMEVEELQGRVYDVIMSERRLGNVYDVRPLRYDPAFEFDANEQTIYWASIQVAFRVARRE